jgi:inositol oxygenase
MKMISNQTMNYVNEKKNHFNSFPQQEYSIWEVCNMMNEIVDESDPDTDLP